MSIRVIPSPDDLPGRLPLQTGPYSRVDDGEITEAQDHPHCPHCGAQRLAGKLSSHTLNQCEDCGKWFYFRRVYTLSYVTCTKRRHLNN